MNNLQHPTITAIERYGYPTKPKVVCQCSECDNPIYEGETAYKLPRWGWVCEDCINAAMEIAE